MEVGTEISQKIRSAIKAKLLELGSYVDDELPDYIMVMVANKKNKEQMSGDLSLFLGTNTDTFTSWLHGLLTKLQSITVDTGKSSSEKVKLSKDKKKDKKDTNKDPQKSGSISKRKDKNVEDDQSKLEAHIAEAETKTHEEDGTAKSTDQTNLTESGASRSQQQEDFEDFRQLLTTETAADDLAEELETTEAEVAATATVKPSSKGSLNVKSKVPLLQSETETHSSSSNTQSAERQVEKSSLGIVRKRKAPTSVVASVNKHNRRDEEEYDPYNPAVGSVASVVKVTSRKSSLPLSLQANRALLVKAMSEAEQSIAVKRKVGVTRPMHRDDSPNEVYTPKRRKSENTQREESPPPYIPSRKENTGKARVAGLHIHRTQSSQDNRRELISRSRRHELIQKSGTVHGSQDERSVQSTSLSSRTRQESVEEEVPRRTEIVRGRGEVVRNFKITAPLVHSSPRAPLDAREKISDQKKVVRSSADNKLLKVTVKPSMNAPRVSAVSRLGGVRKRALSKTEEDSVPDNIPNVKKASVPDQKRLTVSKLGRDAFRKQCEIAVLSVKGTRVEKKITESPDSRVVQAQDEGDSNGSHESHQDSVEENEEDIEYEKTGIDVQIKRSDGEYEEQIEDNDDAITGDAEDLAEMIDDDLEPELLDDHDVFELEDDLIKVYGDIDVEENVGIEGNNTRKEDVMTEQGRSTRFIVTLDGVDEQLFEQELTPQMKERLSAPKTSVIVNQEQESLILSNLAQQSRPVNYSRPGVTQAPHMRITPPKIQPFSICLKDSDDEHEDKDKTESKSAMLGSQGYPIQAVHAFPNNATAESAIQKAKMTERCKFWPACAAGTSCEFHHPSSLCKTFPNCKFGNKCLFIHPNCKYDSKCARPDCPFTHTSHSALSSTPHVIAIPQPAIPIRPSYSGFTSPYSGGTQSSTMCRYFPNCHNANCPFVHPKPCHFGTLCKNMSCPFYHPPVPTKDRLKWQAQTSSQAKDSSQQFSLSKTFHKPTSATTATVSSTSL